MAVFTREQERAYRENVLQDGARDRREMRVPRREIAPEGLAHRLSKRTTEDGAAIDHGDGVVSWAPERGPTEEMAEVTYKFMWETRDWPIVFLRPDGDETVVTLMTDPRSPFVGRRVMLAVFPTILAALGLVGAKFLFAVPFALMAIVLWVSALRGHRTILDKGARDMLPELEWFPIVERLAAPGEMSAAATRVRVDVNPGEGGKELEEVPIECGTRRERGA